MIGSEINITEETIQLTQDSLIKYLVNHGDKKTFFIVIVWLYV